jgi:hypothetical protein|tara:strand:+ start:21 stop:308 length:288 start_codon:yes stop_codon:yes gene_type:complete
MKMAKNPLGKGKKVDDPYAIFKAGDFEIRVLKTYKVAKNEEGDQYARWYTVAKSPMTYGSWEYGDTYRREVIENFSLTYASPEFTEAYPGIRLAA